MASTRKLLITLYGNNKCADQPTHPRSLISAFVIPGRYLEIYSSQSSMQNFNILNTVCSGAGWLESDLVGYFSNRLSSDEAVLYCTFDFGPLDYVFHNVNCSVTAL